MYDTIDESVVKLPILTDPLLSIYNNGSVKINKKIFLIYFAIFILKTLIHNNDIRLNPTNKIDPRTTASSVLFIVARENNVSITLSRDYILGDTSRYRTR